MTSIDQKIHIVLEKLNGSPWSKLETDIPNWLLAEKIESDSQDVYLIIHTLITEGLTVRMDLSGSPKYHITRKGRIIKENGGWNEYVLKEQALIQLRKKKDEYDFKNSKYLVKVQWWPIVISVLGLIISIKNCSNQIDSVTPKPELEIQKNVAPLHDPPTMLEKIDSSKVFSSDSIK